MRVPLPNIVLVLATGHEPQSPAPAAHGYVCSACLAGESWATNLVSLLSSSVPSHHRVWTGEDKLGIHVDPLAVPLKKAGYRAIFIGHHDSKNLAEQCRFDDLIILPDGNGSREVTALIERQDARPAFITCVVPAISSQWQGIAPRLAARGESLGIVLLSRLAPPRPLADAVVTDPRDLSSPFTLSLHEGGNRVDAASHIWSVIDLAPSLLGLLGIKAPYTMVGRDLHQYWLGKPRKAIPFPRDRCLFEHADGSKTMWNGRYLLAVHPGQEAGEIFDLCNGESAARNLWNDPQAADIKNCLLLELLWAQLDKECMPMPRIAGALWPCRDRTSSSSRPTSTTGRYSASTIPR
nr:hypothetical protein [Candidatus Sigynarchaeum springense]